MIMGHRWNYTYIGQEECSQRARFQCSFLRRKSNIDWLGLEPVLLRWVARSHGTAWKDLRSIRKYDVEEIWRGLYCVWQGLYGKKLLSLKWPVNSQLLWNRWVTFGFKTALYEALTKSVFIDQISSLHFTCIYSGNSSLFIPFAALLSKPSIRPSGGIETHIFWIFIISLLLTVCLNQPSVFSHLNVIIKYSNYGGSARDEVLTSVLMKI